MSRRTSSKMHHPAFPFPTLSVCSYFPTAGPNYRTYYGAPTSPLEFRQPVTSRFSGVCSGTLVLI